MVQVDVRAGISITLCMVEVVSQGDQVNNRGIH